MEEAGARPTFDQLGDMLRTMLESSTEEYGYLDMQPKQWLRLLDHDEVRLELVQDHGDAVTVFEEPLQDELKMDGHCGYVTKTTVDPLQGKLERDEHHGGAVGIMDEPVREELEKVEYHGDGAHAMDEPVQEELDKEAHHGDGAAATSGAAECGAPC